MKNRCTLTFSFNKIRNKQQEKHVVIVPASVKTTYLLLSWYKFDLKRISASYLPNRSSCGSFLLNSLTARSKQKSIP